MPKPCSMPSASKLLARRNGESLIAALASAAARSAGSGDSKRSVSPLRGVDEAEPRRVQRLARESELRRRGAAAAVDRIAQHRQPDRRQVHAHLVRAAGLEPYAQQCRPAQPLLDRGSA